MTILVPLRGDLWVRPDNGEPTKLGPRDVGLLRGPDHYTVADDTATRPDVLVGADGRCRSFAGEELEESMTLGVRTWGTNPNGASSMLIGTYAISGDVGGRILGALPEVAAIDASSWDSRLTDLVAEEIVRDEPGQESVLDRLLDLLLVAALRAWFTRPGVGAPGWIRAQSEPSIALALRLMQHNPRHPWTVAELAREAGLSRAAFSRRFSELVGEPPMAYLTSWRLDLAADLLLEPGATVGSVADQVGYGSSFAMSSAFKRERGVSPKEHRQARLQLAAAHPA